MATPFFCNTGSSNLNHWKLQDRWGNTHQNISNGSSLRSLFSPFIIKRSALKNVQFTERAAWSKESRSLQARQIYLWIPLHSLSVVWLWTSHWTPGLCFFEVEWGHYPLTCWVEIIYVFIWENVVDPVHTGAASSIVMAANHGDSCGSIWWLSLLNVSSTSTARGKMPILFQKSLLTEP